MIEIRWSELALSDYDKNLEYLLNRWTEREVLAFNIKVAKTLNGIRRMPTLYPVAEIGGTWVHRAVITKHVTLFYAVNDNYIELIRFKNNYQAPLESLEDIV